MNINAETLSRYAYRYARNTFLAGRKWPYANLWFSEYIPAAKIEHARQSFADLKDEESALLLIDNPDAEAMEPGLLLTDQNIYYSLPYSATEKRVARSFIPVEDVTLLEFLQRESGTDVNLNGMQLGFLSNLNAEETMAIKTFFKKLFAKELGRLTGAEQYAPESGDMEILDQEDPRITEKLWTFDNHQHAYCLQCGYDGLMGIEKKCLPWYLTWWFIAPLIISSVGLIPGLLLWLNRSSALKFRVKCPNCAGALETL